MFAPLPIERPKAMLPKPIARELVSLIEQYVQATVRVHVVSQFTPNTNLELDEKHNAQKVKAALYKLIDLHTSDQGRDTES